MDNRLVFAVLFVMLSWVSVGTYAQATTTISATTATAAATTKPETTATAAATTKPATGATTAKPATGATTEKPATEATTAKPATGATTEKPATGATTAKPETGATTAKPATGATTAKPETGATTAKPATEATTAKPATGATTAKPATEATTAKPATGATTAKPATGATTAKPATTAANTVAPPLMPNTTVEALQTDINSTGCGTEQLCAAQPSSCDPSNAGSCFFLAAKRQSGQNFEFALAGESDGYLAATLSTDSTLGDNDTTYVCANNNSVVQFFGALLNDGQLVMTELNVNSVKGKVTGRKIECTFAATVPVSRVRTTSFVLGISNGSFSSTTGSLGAPTTQLRSATVNLADPNTTVTNQLSTTTTTTASPSTTSHGITLQQSLTQALLIFAGVLSLTML